MNILIVHEVDWLKKVTYEIHHLSELFSLSGHNVYAIDVPDPRLISVNTIINPQMKDYHRIYEKATVMLFRTPIIPIRGLNRISAYLFSYYFIKKILKRYKIDVVLLYSVVTNAKATVKACEEMKIPIFHRTFDIIHDLIRENYLRKIVLRIEKSIYPKFDRVIANTPFMKIWADQMGATNVIVIPQGVDPEIMKPLPRDIELQKKLGFTDKDKIVMYLGSIESFSGLNYLIDKIPDILREIPEFKMLVVGGGSHLENLKAQSKKLDISDRIIFTGYRPYLEVPRYCSLATLCVNTFVINEMTNKLSPVKIFDLLSCGKPVLATPLEGLLHDFPKNSNTVLYSELEVFDKNIISLLKSNTLDMIGKNGRNFVERNFTWITVTKKFLEIFSNNT